MIAWSSIGAFIGFPLGIMAIVVLLKDHVTKQSDTSLLLT